VDHPICAGFAINLCLFMSPGGMLEMSRHGVMCSALRQDVTAVENNETARRELWKAIAMGRVALAFGSGFDMADFTAAIRREGPNRAGPPSGTASRLTGPDREG
jgi:hypothetical protein